VDTILTLMVADWHSNAQLILAGSDFNGIARLTPDRPDFAERIADITRMLTDLVDYVDQRGPGSNPHIYETWRRSRRTCPLKKEVIAK